MCRRDLRLGGDRICMGIAGHRRDGDPLIGIWRAPIDSPVPRSAADPLSDLYELIGLAVEVTVGRGVDEINLMCEWLGEQELAPTRDPHQLVVQFGHERVPEIVDEVRGRSVLFACRFQLHERNWISGQWTSRAVVDMDAELLIGHSSWTPAPAGQQNG